MSTDQLESLLTDIQQEIEVAAPVEKVFRAVIARMSDQSTGPGGQPMPLVLEERPGGRWYRDLGSDSGHLWGHVQAIKPPHLLEICGPLWMSYAVTNNVIIRLEETDGGTRVSLRHQFFGVLPDNYRTGVNEGWTEMLNQIKGDFAN